MRHVVLSASTLVFALAAPAHAADPPAATATAYTAWQDPREGAFEVMVPKGWQVTGGTIRAAAIEPHYVVRAAAPDGGIQVLMGDPDIHPREIPNPPMIAHGFREGQQIPAAWGGTILLQRYRSGVEYAGDYLRAKYCPQATNLRGGAILDQTQQANAQLAQIGRAQGKAVHAEVGDVSFKCGDRVGYLYAMTLRVAEANGQGAELWEVFRLAGYLASPAASVQAANALHGMLGTFRMNPAWEAQFQRQINDVTGTVIRMQNAMTESVVAHARQEASAGGLNHPNEGVPWKVQDKWKQLDTVGQRESEARLGTKHVCDDIGRCDSVSTSATHWWVDHSGAFVPGPESGGPPDNSGRWRAAQ